MAEKIETKCKIFSIGTSEGEMHQYERELEDDKTMAVFTGFNVFPNHINAYYKLIPKMEALA